MVYLDQLVNIKVLKIMRFEHANELLMSYPIGTKVIFTHELEKWQKKNQALPLDLDSAKYQKELASIKPNEPVIQKPFMNIDLVEILNSSTQGIMIINYLLLLLLLN